MTRIQRAATGAAFVGFVLLLVMAALVVTAKPQATYTYDGYGVNRLLDRLVSDLNAKDAPAVAVLVAGESRTSDGPRSGGDDESARAWIDQYGGSGLHNARYQWRRDSVDAMRSKVKVTAADASAEPVVMWLTVFGSTMGYSQTESLAASISGPEQDTGVGASPLTAMSALDRVMDPRRTRAAVAGWTGAACLLFGGVVAIAGAGRSRRRRLPQSTAEEPVASGER